MQQESSTNYVISDMAIADGAQQITQLAATTQVISPDADSLITQLVPESPENGPQARQRQTQSRRASTYIDKKKERERKQHQQPVTRMRGRGHNAAVVDAVPTLSSEAETRAGCEAHREVVAPLKQAPEEATAREWADEHRDVLQRVHPIPGWEAH